MIGKKALITVVAAVVLGAGLMISPALAKCGKDCKTVIKTAFKTCKGGCAKGKAGKPCRKACKGVKKANLASCKAPSCTPTPPTCACAPPGDCTNNLAGGPRQVTYTVADNGTDLDTGTSGVSHNFPIIAMAHSRLCLSECDASTNPVCKGSGPTGEGTFNGATFGPPLPLFAANVATCVINNFADPMIQGTVNVQTGLFDSKVGGVDTPVHLNSQVFNTSATQVCPQCKNGSCDLGPSAGKSCQVEGTVRVINPSQGINQLYSLSHSCPPGPPQGSMTGTIPVSLPITSGTSSLSGRCPGQTSDDDCGSNGGTCVTDSCLNQPDVKGGFNQSCCSVGGAPCFPTAHSPIVRTGTPMPPTPLWPDPTYPKTGTGAKLVATFCIASSHSILIDGVAGLPGPGAVVFNGTQVWDGNQ